MFYRLIDDAGKESGILQVNIECDEFERLAKEYTHTTGSEISTKGIAQFLTNKGYAVINVDPVEIPLTI